MESVADYESAGPGSTPGGPAKFLPVAQRIVRRPPKAEAAGPNPARQANMTARGETDIMRVF